MRNQEINKRQLSPQQLENLEHRAIVSAALKTSITIMMGAGGTTEVFDRNKSPEHKKRVKQLNRKLYPKKLKEEKEKLGLSNSS